MSRYQRSITASHMKDKCDLELVCRSLGSRAPRGEFPAPSIVTKEGVDLLKRLLAVDHEERATASVALSHSFLKDVPH